MTINNKVSVDILPKQSGHLHKKTKVCFNYDTKNTICGMVVRDDLEAPFLTLIKLEDGRYISSMECQYSYPV